MFVNFCQACAVNFGDMCEVVGQHNTETYLVCISSVFSVRMLFGFIIHFTTV